MARISRTTFTALPIANDAGIARTPIAPGQQFAGDDRHEESGDTREHGEQRVPRRVDRAAEQVDEALERDRDSANAESRSVVRATSSSPNSPPPRNSRIAKPPTTTSPIAAAVASTAMVIAFTPHERHEPRPVPVRGGGGEGRERGDRERDSDES